MGLGFWGLGVFVFFFFWGVRGGGGVVRVWGFRIYGFRGLEAYGFQGIVCRG